jgi:hypothetical protein
MKRTTRIIATSVVTAAVVVGAGAAYAIAASDDGSLDGNDKQRAGDAAPAETGGGTITEVEIDDDGHDVEVRLEDGTEIDVELADDFTVRSSDSDDSDDSDDQLDDDLPLDEAARQQAAATALAEAGRETVTDVEHDSNGYDAEVRLDDGREIDVELATDSP